jgi:thioredoxin reductase
MNADRGVEVGTEAESSTGTNTGTGANTDGGADAVDLDADVCIVGAGVAGLACGTYTARAGLDTVLVDGGESILRRNAHLENVPGFPLGVNARTFLDLTEVGATEAGCRVVEGTAVEFASGTPLSVELEDGRRVRADRVVVASWSDASYLPAEVATTARGSKTYVDVDGFGRTTLTGVYAAGRIAGRPHQTVVAAGHGAEVGLSVIEDSDVAYYHDWIVPEGYFTDRGRECPPGCEEIPEAEWVAREERSIERMREVFGERHPDAPTPHPSQVEDG